MVWLRQHIYSIEMQTHVHIVVSFSIAHALAEYQMLVIVVRQDNEGFEGDIRWQRKLKL